MLQLIQKGVLRIGDDAYPATDAEHAGHFRKMLASLTVRLFGDNHA
jgi:hypothetical protein